MDQTRNKGELAKTIAPHNQPTGKPLLSPLPRRRFSLEDDEPSDHLHNQLFFSHNLEQSKAELKRLEDQENEKIPGERANTHIEQLREQIKLLESVAAPYGLEELCQRYEVERAMEFELIHVLAGLGGKYQKAFDSLSRNTYESFWQIKRLARKRHPGAIRELAQIAYEATEVLGDLGKSEPELLKPAAETRIKWPMFRSKHKQFQLVPDDDEQSYFRKIGLGEKSSMDLEPAKRYQPELPETVIAMKLKDYVEGVRLAGREHFTKNPDDSDPFVKYLGEDPPPWATNLPDIVKTDAIVPAAWWKIAKAFLIDSYPGLVKNSVRGRGCIPPMLHALVPAVAEKDKRGRIFKIIEAKFLQLLRKPPMSTRPLIKLSAIAPT